jgi:DNA-binding CsgD family transcriptional regulator
MNGGRSTRQLWERDGELAAIDDVLDRSAAGTGAGLLLAGVGGIGKSSLLAAARERADARAMRVIAARGGLLEHEYAFGVALQLLGGLAEDPAERAVLLAGGGAAAAPVLAPSEAVVRAPDTSFAVLYGLFWAVANLAAQQPLLICVDDAQWSDEPTLLFLDFLVRRLEELPVALVVAVRSGEPPAGASPALTELCSGVALRVIEPAPLSAGAVLELTRATFGPEAEAPFAAACHARTAGNPFFATELLRSLADEQVKPTAEGARRLISTAPAAVGRVVLARLVRLGPAATDLARAVGVLGDHTLISDAAELAGLSPEVAAAAAEALTAAGVFGTGDGLGFAHPLMRDAVNADTSAPVLAARHAHAARVLDAHDRDPQLIAAHLLASPPNADDRAVDRLRAAARVALGRGAPEEAVTLLDRALSEPPSARIVAGVRFELGLAEAAAQRPSAIAHLEAAHASAQDRRERATVALALSEMLMLGGRWRDVYPLLAQARGQLGEPDRELALALDASVLTASQMDPRGPRLTPQRIAELTALTGATRAESALLACTAFELCRGAHPIHEVTALVGRALEGGAGRFATASVFSVPLMVSTVLQWSGEITRARELAGLLLDEARAAGSPFLFSEVCAFRAMTAWWGGALVEAEADARQALETVGPVTGMTSPVASACLIRVLTDQGRFDEAYQLASANAQRPDLQDTVIGEILDCALGRLEVATGQYAAALARLSGAGQIVEAAGTVNPTVSEWRLHATYALVGLGRADEARELLAPALAAAERSGGPYELASCLRALAHVDPLGSLEWLEQSCVGLEASELRLEYARSLVDLGAALRRSGQRRDAREPLVTGMDLAHRCGAAPLAQRAREELLAAGARPRRAERTGIDALTASERRTAALAVDGLSNREIAQHLFVSSRTVESHLRRAYMKLGLSSRRELAATFTAAEISNPPL